MPPEDDQQLDDVPDYLRWMKAFSGDDDDMLVGDRPSTGPASPQKAATGSTAIDYFSITRAIASGRTPW